MIFDRIIPAVWLFGTLGFGLFMLLGWLQLKRKIKASIIHDETDRYSNMLQKCKERLNITRYVAVVWQSHVKTPALFGVFRPKIILPDYSEDMSDENLEYIILHELSHLKRGDGFVNALLLTLQTIYWFNPLTWVLFKFIREDMEVANDSAVLKSMKKEEQKAYSLSLVEVLAKYSNPKIMPKLLCMVDSEKNIERRITMIKLGEFFKRRKWIIAISGVLIIAITATLFLTVGAAKSNHQKDENALMTSLGYTHEILESIQKNKIPPYVEYDAKISAIINQLPVTWKGLSFDSCSLENKEELYSLTINYKQTTEKYLSDFTVFPFFSTMEENNALLLFSAVDNLSEVSFVRLLDMQIMTFTRDDIWNIFRGIPSIDSFTDIYNRLSENLKIDEFYFSHVSRYYLIETQPEDVVYREGGEPDTTKNLSNGLSVYIYNELGKYFSESEEGTKIHSGYDISSAVRFYFNATGLFATRYIWNPANAASNYSDYITIFGKPHTEKTIDGKKYVSYLLHPTTGYTNDSPDGLEKRAWFLFENDREVERGLMLGDNYSVLSTEKSDSGPDIKSGDAEMFLTATKISSDKFLQINKNMTMQQVMDALG